MNRPYRKCDYPSGVNVTLQNGGAMVIPVQAILEAARAKENVIVWEGQVHKFTRG